MTFIATCGYLEPWRIWIIFLYFYLPFFSLPVPVSVSETLSSAFIFPVLLVVLLFKLIRRNFCYRRSVHFLRSFSISFCRDLKLLYADLLLVWLELPQDFLYYLWLLWRQLFAWFLSQPVYPLYKGRLLIYLS